MLWLIFLLSGISVVHAEDIKGKLQELDRNVKEQVQRLKPSINVPKIKEEERERLKKQVQNLQRKALEETQDLRYDNGKILVEERPKGKLFLSDRERLYIAMSSSVPKHVWKSYAKAIEDYGLSDKAFLVLRGCIGGCTYIKPTLNFIQDILTQGKSQIRAEVHIDPLVFRRFGIDRVPCFIFVEGDDLINPELSAGLSENLKSKGRHYISCGDWAFSWHMQELCKKGAKSLCGIASQGINQKGREGQGR